MSNNTRAAFSTFNGYAPKEGTKALPVDFDFRTTGVIDVDLQVENTNGVIQMVQSIWIDNTNNPNPLTIVFGVTRQRIVCPASAHGMWPVITVDQVSFRMSSVVSAGAVGQVILLNVPMPYTQGGPVTVNANVTAAPIQRVNETDFSGTIAAGGVSQIAIAANALRYGLLIQNPTNEIEPLLLEFGNVAAPGVSIELLPGEKFVTNNFVSIQSVNVRAATTGHAFIAKEYA